MIFKKRAPLVLQMEAAECGAACLAMVLAAHGRWITLEEARERCGTSRDGVDAAGLIEAAQSYGMNAMAFRQEPEDLRDLPMPQIIHWCFNHFVVLEAVKGATYTILDPAKGRCTVDGREFGDSFTGLTIAFEPSESFKPEGQAPSVLAALVREASQSRDALAVSFTTGLIGVIPALALAGATSAFVDYVLGAKQSSWIPALIAVLIAVVAVKATLAIIHKRTVATWKIKIGAVSALRGFWRALTLPLAYYAQRSAGEVVSRIRLGSEIGSTVAGPLADLMPQVALATGYLLILALFDPIIMIVAFAVAMLNLAALTAMTRALADRTREHQVAEGRAAAVATSGMANIAAYRQLGREQLLLSRWTAAEDQALEAEQRLGYWKALTNLGPVASGLLLSLVALVVGALRAVEGTLSLGDLVAVQMLAGLLNSPVAALANAICQIQEAAGALMRLSDLEGHPPAPAFTTPARTLEAPSPDARLVMSDVSFGYSAGAPLLCNINLTLEPGRLVAVLGPSGAGKSTMARLAAGLVEPTSGRVTYGGLELHAYPQDILRRDLVYVTQAPASFSGSIEENITLWDPDINSAQVRDAADKVGLNEALLRRSGGLAAKINGGSSNLSGGEMQRLALARALARQPKLLVLDETTSALDTSSEEHILDLLRASGAAVLIVTHRPGTAMRCDEALLVKGGTIVARGEPGAILANHRQVEAKAA